MQVYGSPLLGKLINDDTAYLLVLVFQVALTGTLAVCGIVINAINIVIFIKLGLNDVVNVSLFGLAVSDLLSLVFSLWESICFNPLFQFTDIPVVFTEIEYITGCWPHVCLVSVASYITALITLERCLCIIVPLKIATIITAARTKLIIFTIYCVATVTTIPEFYVTQLVWKFYPEKNRTMVGILFMEDRGTFESVTLILNNVLLQFVAFLSVLICTIIIMVKLKRKIVWRHEHVQGVTIGSRKEQKVIKMISLISIIFIISDLPSCINIIAMLCAPSLHPSGINYNTFYVLWSIVYLMEGINSSANIFVYLNMSSKYRKMFQQTFHRCKTMKQKDMCKYNSQVQLTSTTHE